MNGVCVRTPYQMGNKKDNEEFMIAYNNRVSEVHILKFFYERSAAKNQKAASSEFNSLWLTESKKSVYWTDLADPNNLLSKEQPFLTLSPASLEKYLNDSQYESKLPLD